MTFRALFLCLDVPALSEQSAALPAAGHGEPRLFSIIMCRHPPRFEVCGGTRDDNLTTQNEIEQYQQKPPSEITEFYINECLMHNFTHAAVLVAECLAEYYQTGELVVYDYVGENYDPVEHRVKDFIVTSDALQSLLEVLQSVQDPEHWRYQCWVDDETCQRWLTHIQSVYQTLKDHT